MPCGEPKHFPAVLCDIRVVNANTYRSLSAIVVVVVVVVVVFVVVVVVVLVVVVVVVVVVVFFEWDLKKSFPVHISVVDMRLLSIDVHL